MAFINIAVNDERLQARFIYLPGRIKEKLRAAVAMETEAVESRIKEKLSGEVLNLKTGALRDSIYSIVEEGPFTVTGKVASNGNAKYAHIQEYGGVVKHPGSGKFQMWEDALGLGNSAKYQGWVFTHGTRPHDIPIPERSYLRSTMREMADSIKSEIKAAIRAGVSE